MSSWLVACMVYSDSMQQTLSVYSSAVLLRSSKAARLLKARFGLQDCRRVACFMLQDPVFLGLHEQTMATKGTCMLLRQ